MKLIDNLDRYGIKSIWHFTDRSNLASIERHGLLSLSEIARRSVNVSAFGANEESHTYDRRFGLDRFVHLSFLMDHPMYYVAVRRKSIRTGVWLEIGRDILLRPGTRCCDRVANSYNARTYSVDECAEHIRFDRMFSPYFDEMKEARKAEILIPRSISVNHIKGVHLGK